MFNMPKQTVALLVVLVAVALPAVARAEPTGAPMPVNRWWHSGDRDWVTLRDGEIADAQMMAAGYSNKTFLFFAYAAPNGAAYFSLGQPTTVLTQTLPWEQSEPHTFSVVEANSGGF